MRKAKVLICAALSAAALGGSLIAASPRPAPVAEACVVYAQSGGACVLPGRSPGVDSEPRVLVIRERHIAGILPEIEAETENEAEEAETPAGGTSSVTASAVTPSPEGKAGIAYTEEERELLACAIYCEAGGDACTDETRRMVGEVILNRVADPRFPSSIEGVLTQKSQYGRFHWTGVVWPSRAAHEPEAVERAYRCAEAVLTEPRLLPEDVVFQAEFVQGEIVASAPGYYFCRDVKE